MDSGVKILKIIGIVISVFIITVIAQNLGILWHVFKWHRIESILHAITYIIAVYLLIKLFITMINYQIITSSHFDFIQACLCLEF